MGCNTLIQFVNMFISIMMSGRTSSGMYHFDTICKYVYFNNDVR